MTKRQSLNNSKKLTYCPIYQSLGRFVFLLAITCGTYGLYWHYKHWYCFGYRRFSAVCFTLFSPLTISGLARHIFQLANDKGIKVGIEPKIFLLAYFIGNIISSQGPGLWSLLGLLMIVLPMLYMQHCLNLYWVQQQPQCQKSLFLSAEVVGWSVLGVGIWMSSLTSDMGAL